MPCPLLPSTAPSNRKSRVRPSHFGPWCDAGAALARWLAQKDALYAGREPLPIGPDDLTVRELCNDFLAAKKAKVASGELNQRTWDEYFATCHRLVDTLGGDTAVTHLVAQDFQRLRTLIQKRWGPVRTGNEIQRCRCVFRHGVSTKLLHEAPPYGDGFQKPSRKMLRRNRNQKGPRMFSAEQLRELLEAAGPTLRAMILLAINCGFGNHDVATVERKHLDLKNGWAEYPRPKTEIRRRCPLWPETVRAVRRVLRRRKAGSRPGAEIAKAKRGYRRLLFLTKHGRPWRAKSGSPISEEFGRLVRRLGIWRPGLCFYALRHTFETVGGATKDQVAVDAIMGHAAESDDMAAVYREAVDDERLRAVADHVHAWLFGEEKIQG